MSQAMLLLLLGWELHRPQWVALCDINSAPHLLVLLFHLLVRFHGDTVLILFAGTAAVVAHRDRVGVVVTLSEMCPVGRCAAACFIRVCNI